MVALDYSQNTTVKSQRMCLLVDFPDVYNVVSSILKFPY